MTSSRQHGLRRLLTGSVSVVAATALLTAQAAAGGLTGGEVISGGASISAPDATTTIITQTTGNAIINWKDFSIPDGSRAVFVQPSSSAITLNRVVGSSASSIDGSLLANGRVWIVNGNGILFGKGSQINVGSLLATTSDIANSDFLNGKYNFAGASSNPNASVVNKGSIRTGSGGSVVLAGPVVSNEGLIQADLGSVVLGGANTFTVDFQGDKLIQFAVTAPVSQTPVDENGQPQKGLVSNSGKISAQGGKILLTARAAENVAGNVINSAGIVEANSVRNENGTIVFDAGPEGDVDVGGNLSASGNATGETGGAISVTGKTIKVADGARIDASGDSGGGAILIGGNPRGAGPLKNAQTTIVGNAVINADAIRTGNGGTVVAWSDRATDFAGRVSARGGAGQGNGGFVETSGGALRIAPTATVDTRAPMGQAGNWLLDPENIIVQSGGATLLSGGALPLGTDPGMTDTVDPLTIINALATTNVTLEASQDISVFSDVSYNSDYSLSFLAQRDIHIASNVQNQGLGAVTAIAGWSGTSTDTAAIISGSGYGISSGSIYLEGPANAVAFGSAGGLTTVAGSSVQVLGTAGASQIGYYGAGGGAIDVRAKGALVLTASTSIACGACYAQIGNGGDAANGNKTGNIQVIADTVSLTAGNDDYVQIGNGAGNRNGGGDVTGDISVKVSGSASFDNSNGGSAWIGNVAGGAFVASGNVTLIAGDIVDDSLGGGVGSMLIEDLGTTANSGGNVTVGLTGLSDVEIDNLIAYSSPHEFTILSVNNIKIEGAFQNSGTGAITLLAGWDGTTLGNTAALTQAGVYGNNNGGIVIGGANAAGNAAVGSAGGLTTLAGAQVLLAAVNGYAQLGYHGATSGGISVIASGTFDMSGGATPAKYVQAGAGATFGSNAAGGDVTIAAQKIIASGYQVLVAESASINLSSTGGINGGLGTQAAPLHVAVGNLAIQTAGADAFIASPDQGLSIGVGGVGGILASGKLTITANGAVGQIESIAAGALDVSTTSGAITLDDADNAFGTLTVGTQGTDDALINNSSAVTVAGAEVGGKFTLTSDGAVDQSGAITAARLDVSTTNGTIILDDAGNAFAALSVETTGTDDATINDSRAVTIGSATVGGKFTLTADGAIDQIGAIVADALDVATTAGAILLNDIGNMFATLTVGTTGADNAGVTDASAVTIASAAVGGTFTLRAGGVIGQSGAMTAGALDVSTSSGTVTLNDSSNAFSTLTVGTQGVSDASLKTSGAVSVAGATVGGQFTLTSGGAISQTGAISADVLDVSTTSGAITLNDSGNAFATLTVGTQGTSDASLKTSGAVTIARATIGGKFTLASGGAIGQTGVITAGALDVSTTSGAITLNDGSNAFATLTVGTQGPSDASLKTSGALTIAGATVGGKFTLVADGVIDQTGAITAATLDVSTTSGAIMLNDGSNAFATLTVGTQGTDDASLNASGAVTIAGATVGGKFTLVSGGAITQSGTITADALDVSTTSGAIALNDGSNAFATLTVGTQGTDDASVTDTGAVTIAGATVGGTFAVASDGAIGQSGAITADALDVSTTSGAITLNDSANSFARLTIGTQGISDAAVRNSAAVTMVGATVGGKFTLAADGAIDQTGAIIAATLDVSTTSGVIALNDAGNAFASLTVGTQGTDEASVTDSSAVTITDAAVGGTFTLRSDGPIDQIGAIVAEALDVATTSGAILLDNIANAFDTLTVGTQGTDDVTITDASAVTIAGATVGGKFTLLSGGAMDQAGAIVAQTLDVSTTSGAVTLNDAGNSFATLTVGTQGIDDASLRALGAVAIAGATVGGKFTLVSGGAIGQSASIVAGALDVSAASGAITLNDSANIFAGLKVATQGASDATVRNSTATTIAGAAVGGKFKFLSGGAIGQTGAIVAPTLDIATTGGAISLSNAGNAFSTLTVATHGTSDASLRTSGAVTIASAMVGGKFTLLAGGAIGQTGAIVVPSLDVATTGGAITLNNAGNLFTTLRVGTQGMSDASLRASGAVTLAGAAVGGKLTLLSGGAISQTGSIVAGALDVSATNGAITLNNASNAFAGLKVVTQGASDATIRNSTAVTIASASVGGKFKLSSGGAISQTGAIVAPTLDVSTSSGAITLNNAGNAFATLTVGTQGTGDASLKVSNAVTIAGASVGGKLTLVSAGPITQTGAIIAGALDASATSGAITLNNAGNAFGALKLVTQNDAGVTNTSTMTIMGVTAGGKFTLRSGGTVNQAGAIVTQTLDLSTIGDIALTSAANAFGQLALSGTGSGRVYVSSSSLIIGNGAVTTGNLIILSKGDLTFTASAYSLGGSVLAVAGWDGVTTNPAALLAGTAFGNNGGSIIIGGPAAPAGVYVGSLNGITSVGAANLTVSAVHGFAQLGYRGVSSGGIAVNVSGAVNLMAGTVAGYYAQIGNGGYQISGSNSGAIGVSAVGGITLAGGGGDDTYAQIGNGGAKSNIGSAGYSNSGAVTVSGQNVILTSGTGTGSYSQIGHGGFQAGMNLTGAAINSGDITVTAAQAVSLNGGGFNAYSQIGNGGGQVNSDAGANASGLTSGNVIVFTPNNAGGSVTLGAGPGANAYAQIGNGGYASNANTSAANFLTQGDVTVTDLVVAGGGGANSYAQIGNGDASFANSGNVSGDITIAAFGNITVTNGLGTHAKALIGNASGNGTVSGILTGYVDLTGNSSTYGTFSKSGQGTQQNLSSGGASNPAVGGADKPGQSKTGGSERPLEELTNGSGGNTAPGSKADNVAESLGRSLESARASTATTLIFGLLTQIVASGNKPRGVPPADANFSSWGNEALWQ